MGRHPGIHTMGHRGGPGLIKRYQTVKDGTIRPRPRHGASRKQETRHQPLVRLLLLRWDGRVDDQLTLTPTISHTNQADAVGQGGPQQHSHPNGLHTQPHTESPPIEADSGGTRGLDTRGASRTHFLETIDSVGIWTHTHITDTREWVGASTGRPQLTISSRPTQSVGEATTSSRGGDPGNANAVEFDNQSVKKLPPSSLATTRSLSLSL
jgi:hypothetical protein